MFQGKEYVCAVYEESSFSKAAQRLCISQPSLSANVKRIERKIGYPLFDRSTNPITLTECGEHYIRSAKQIAQLETGFSNYVNDLGELKTGSLVLGASSMYAAWVLPSLIGEFSGRYPKIHVELREENTAELTEMLRNGQIDLMLDNCRLDRSIFGYRVFREETLFLTLSRALVPDEARAYEIPVEAICDGAWRVNGNESLFAPAPAAVFAEVPFLLLKPENDTCRRAAEYFREANFSPRVVLELDQQLTSFHVACSGLGAAFVSDTLIARVHPGTDMAYFGLPGKQSQRNICFYWKAGRYLTRAMEEFLKNSHCKKTIKTT